MVNTCQYYTTRGEPVYSVSNDIHHIITGGGHRSLNALQLMVAVCAFIGLHGVSEIQRQFRRCSIQQKIGYGFVKLNGIGRLSSVYWSHAMNQLHDQIYISALTTSSTGPFYDLKIAPSTSEVTSAKRLVSKMYPVRGVRIVQWHRGTLATAKS